MKQVSASLISVCLIALTLSGCGRGWRDSLVLTGLRGKPDDSKIVMLDPLVLPDSDEVVVPNSTTGAAAVRGDVYKVHEILFGDELAKQEAERQQQITQSGSLSPTEAQLMQRARSVGQNPSESSVKKKRSWFKLPKLFRR